MRDHYDVLGVPRDAGNEEIKTAFRKLAKNYHPDRNPGDKWAERRFAEVNEAHEILKDAEKRAAYDAELARHEEESESSAGSGIGWFWRIAAVLMFLAGVGMGGFSLYLILTPAPSKKTATLNTGSAAPATPPNSTAAASRTAPGNSEAPLKQPDPPSQTADRPAADNTAAVEWRDLRESSDIPAMRRFAEKYQGAPQVEEAKARLRQVIGESTDRAMLSRLAATPDNDGVSAMARERAVALDQKERSDPDTVAWTRAAQAGSHEELKTYLQNFPSGAHAGEARTQLQNLGLIEVSTGTKNTPVRLWVKPGSEGFRDCAECPELVVVDAARSKTPARDIGGGTGSPGSAGARPAVLGKPLAATRTQITAAQWEACVRDRACMPALAAEYGEQEPGAPIAGVSWLDAQAYIQWLSRKTGHRYRLLTQNEWLSLAEPAADTAPRGYARRQAYYDQTPDVFPPANDAYGEEPSSEDAGGSLNYGSPQYFEWVADCWRDGPGEGRRMGGVFMDDDLPPPSVREYGGREYGSACGKRVLYGRIVMDGRPGALAPARFGDVPDRRDATYTFRIARSF